MELANLLDRRQILKWAGAAPLIGYIATQELAEKAWGAVAKSSKDNIYSRIGVRPFINGRGTWTYLSGSLELPEVKAAKQQAAAHFVDIIELQHAVGRRLADLTGAESGMITSGAAGAMASATAACIAGKDPAKIWQLPDTAMIYTTALDASLEKIIAVAKDAKVPLLLDDAAGIPPIDNMKLYAKMGAD